MQQQNPDKTEIFGERLRIARSQAGLTQVQVAERMQKGSATISDWEKGKSQPSLEDIRRLAELYKVEPSRLAFGFAEIRKSGDTAVQLKHLMALMDLDTPVDVARALGLSIGEIQNALTGGAVSEEFTILINRIFHEESARAREDTDAPLGRANDPFLVGEPVLRTNPVEEKKRAVRMDLETLIEEAGQDLDRLAWINIHLKHLNPPWRTSAAREQAQQDLAALKNRAANRPASQPPKESHG